MTNFLVITLYRSLSLWCNFWLFSAWLFQHHLSSQSGCFVRHERTWCAYTLFFFKLALSFSTSFSSISLYSFACDFFRCCFRLISWKFPCYMVTALFFITASFPNPTNTLTLSTIVHKVIPDRTPFRASDTPQCTCTCWRSWRETMAR